MDAVCTCVSLTVFLYLMVQVPNNMCRFPLFTTVYRIVYENLPAKQITLNL
jgi:glycerol-3-phosphate dehydrogenase